MKGVRSIERSVVRFSKKHPIVWALVIFLLGSILYGVLREFGTDAYNNLRDWIISVSGEPELAVPTLKEQTITLYEDIMGFLKEREANEPPIDFDKWEESTNRRSQYFTETMGLYREKFGARVVAIREEYVRRGIKSDRLDLFYPEPVNIIGIREVAYGLAELAAKLKTTTEQGRTPYRFSLGRRSLLGYPLSGNSCCLTVSLSLHSLSAR